MKSIKETKEDQVFLQDLQDDPFGTLDKLDTGRLPSTSSPRQTRGRQDRRDSWGRGRFAGVGGRGGIF